MTINRRASALMASERVLGVSGYFRGAVFSDDDIGAYLEPTAARHGLISAEALVAETKRYFSNPQFFQGKCLPWEKSYGKFHLRPKEVTAWAGINGHGKSLITGQVALSLMAQDERVMIASMEMPPASTFRRQARQAIGTVKPSDEWLDRFGNWASERLWYYTPQGIVDPRKVIAAARFAQDRLQVQHVIIDSLLKCVPREDDYNAQKSLLEELCALARDTGVHVHLVCHTRKGESEYKAPGKFDIRGSSSIADQVDNIITVYRKKKAVPDDEPDCFLDVHKQRHGEWEGGLALWYEPDSMQFLEFHGHRRYEYIPRQPGEDA